MKFTIIEVKGNDTYVIYDMENYGVCCCSAYTIKQLLAQGLGIGGVTIQNSKLKIQETDLDGKVRIKKAKDTCQDLTKRSAVTIMKGLDEKHYPRTVKSRRGVGSYVQVYCHYNLDGSVQFDNEQGVIVSNGTIILESGGLCSSKSDGLCSSKGYMKNSHYTVKIKTLQPEEVKNGEFLDKMAARYEEYLRKSAIHNKKVKEKEQQISKYKKLIKELEEEISDIKKESKTEYHTVKRDMKAQAVAAKYKDVKGNELVYYTFYNKAKSIPPNLPFDYAKTVVERTDRQIFYTHGLSYRHPSTCRTPISKAQALQILTDYSLVDIDARNPEYIHINTYSDNDMY